MNDKTNAINGCKKYIVLKIFMNLNARIYKIIIQLNIIIIKQNFNIIKWKIKTNQYVNQIFYRI